MHHVRKNKFVCAHDESKYTDILFALHTPILYHALTQLNVPYVVFPFRSHTFCCPVHALQFKFIESIYNLLKSGNEKYFTSLDTAMLCYCTLSTIMFTSAFLHLFLHRTPAIDILAESRTFCFGNLFSFLRQLHILHLI